MPRPRDKALIPGALVERALELPEPARVLHKKIGVILRDTFQTTYFECVARLAEVGALALLRGPDAALPWAGGARVLLAGVLASLLAVSDPRLEMGCSEPRLHAGEADALGQLDVALVVGGAVRAGLELP